MRFHTYSKFSPEAADAVDLQALLDKLADFLLQSGFAGGQSFNPYFDDFDSEPSSPPIVMESPRASSSGTSASAEVVSMDNMRTAMIANFEQEDLDVPAFLRKRGDAM